MISNRTNKKSIFFRWLKNHNCYQNYCFNFNRHMKDAICFYERGKSKEALNYQNFFNILPQNLYIMYAFRWDTTSQGYDYWLKLNTEWEKIST